jgi:hypothetical protein
MCEVVTAFLFGSFDTRNYAIQREALTLAFENMSLFQKESNVWKFLNGLLFKSLQYGRQRKDRLYLRRLKAFDMRYVSGATYEEIGKELDISLRNTYRDLEAIMDSMMILAFGIEASLPKEEEEETTKATTGRTGSRIKQRVVIVPKMNSPYLEQYSSSQTKESEDFINLTEQVMPELAFAVSTGNHSRGHSILESQFSNYSQLKPNDPIKELLDRLLALHKNYAAYSRSEDVIRRGKLFEMKYVKQLDNNNITRLAGINSYALYLECREVIKDMLAFAYGMKPIEDKERIYGNKEF